MNKKEIQSKPRRNPKGFFVNPSGSLRMGWKMLACAAVYFAVYYVVLWGVSMLFGALFNAWGLTGLNLAYAPVWAQRIVAGHADVCYGLTYAASALAALFAARKLIRRSEGSVKSCMEIAIGFGMGMLLTVLSLLFDSMRLERPLAEPAFALWQIMAVVLIILGKTSSEVLLRCIVFDGMRSSARRWIAFLAAGIVSLMLTGVWTNALHIVNTLLMSMLCCALYERGGLWASAGLQSAWTIWTTLVFGFPGMVASVQPVYALYHVSDAWLTGGNTGPMAGAWVTLMLIAALIGLCRKELIRFAKRERRKGK